MCASVVALVVALTGQTFAVTEVFWSDQSPAEIFYTMFEQGHYFGIDSPANLYNQELANFRRVNFNDFAVLAGGWLWEQLWP
jgi:hypothetical protein